MGVESAARVYEHVPLNSPAGRVKERGKGFPSKKIKFGKKKKSSEQVPACVILLLTQKPVDTGIWERSRGMETDLVRVGMWREIKQTRKSPES